MNNNFITSIIDKDLKSKKYKSINLRFPPEPNGRLHLGHAKSIVLNSELAIKYSASLNLRFDDTNPTKESIEFANEIELDTAWLKLNPTNIVFASDYFDTMIECAYYLIKNNLAYVDLTPPGSYKELKGGYYESDKESIYRNSSPLENAALFKRMVDGEFSSGEAVLRAKIDLASPNVCMRDPVLYRIMHVPHYRHGNKYCVYPMYDWAHPISDSIEKISHSLCTLEFENNRSLYNWVNYNLFEVLNHIPTQIEFARLSVAGIALSKRHLIKTVESNLVTGWDDPRMPTICGLRRRGFLESDIRHYILDLGFTKENSEVSIKPLEATAMRREKSHLLGFEEAFKLNFVGEIKKEAILFERSYNVDSNLIIDKKDLKIYNDKAIGIEEGELVRLNHLANFKVHSIDLENKIIEASVVELDALPKLKISWGLENFKKYKIYSNSLNNLNESYVYLSSAADDLPLSSIIEIPRMGTLMKNDMGSYSWLYRVGEKKS